MIGLLKLSPYTGDVLAPSPNHDARSSLGIEGIVLHATADGGNEVQSVSWMRSPTSQVSCHLMVSRSGRVTRLVGDRQRAWHAGLSWWHGTGDVNSITLGIEIANRNDGEPYTDEQYSRVAEIVGHYCCQGLTLHDVVGHAEIAESRKTDPFDWDWKRFRDMVRQQLLVEAPPPVPPVRTPEPRLSVSTALVPSPAPTPLAKPTTATTSPGKPLLRSRTLWLNALTLMAAVPLFAGDTFDLAHRIGITLPPEVVKWALFALGLLNILLRLRTTQPVKCGKDAPCPPADIPIGRPPVPGIRLQERRSGAR